MRLTCGLGLKMARLGVRGLGRRIARLLLVRRCLRGRRIAPAFCSLRGLLWGVVPVGLPDKGRPLVVGWVWLLGRGLWWLGVLGVIGLLLSRVKALCGTSGSRTIRLQPHIGTGRLTVCWKGIAPNAVVGVRLGEALLEHPIVIPHYR